MSSHENSLGASHSSEVNEGLKYNLNSNTDIKLLNINDPCDNRDLLDINFNEKELLCSDKEELLDENEELLSQLEDELLASEEEEDGEDHEYEGKEEGVEHERKQKDQNQYEEEDESECKKEEDHTEHEEVIKEDLFYHKVVDSSKETNTGDKEELEISEMKLFIRGEELLNTREEFHQVSKFNFENENNCKEIVLIKEFKSDLSCEETAMLPNFDNNMFNLSGDANKCIENEGKGLHENNLNLYKNITQDEVFLNLEGNEKTLSETNYEEELNSAKRLKLMDSEEFLKTSDYSGSKEELLKIDGGDFPKLNENQKYNENELLYDSDSGSNLNVTEFLTFNDASIEALREIMETTSKTECNLIKPKDLKQSDSLLELKSEVVEPYDDQKDISLPTESEFLTLFNESEVLALDEFPPPDLKVKESSFKEKEDQNSKQKSPSENKRDIKISGSNLNITVKREIRPEPEYISNDPDENADNFDPKWTVLRLIDNDQERYKAIRKRWRNLNIPNPNVDLTYRHRRKNVDSSKGKSVDSSKGNNDFKMPTASTSRCRETRRTGPQNRRRSRSCTSLYEKMISNVDEKYDQEIERMENDHQMRLCSMTIQQDLEQRQVNFLANVDNSLYNMTMQSVMERQEQEIRWLINNHYSNVKSLNERRKRDVSMYQKYMDEVRIFNSFYQGMNDDESDNTMLTNEQHEHLVETERMYLEFYKIYDPN